MAEKERMETAKEIAKWGGIVAIVGIGAYALLKLIPEVVAGGGGGTEPPVEPVPGTLYINYWYDSGLAVAVNDDRATLEAVFKEGRDELDVTSFSDVATKIAQGYRLDNVTVTRLKYHVIGGDDGWTWHDNWHYYLIQILGSKIAEEEWKYPRDEDLTRGLSLRTGSPRIEIYGKVGARSEWHTANTWTRLSGIRIEGTITLKR